MEDKLMDKKLWLQWSNQHVVEVQEDTNSIMIQDVAHLRHEEEVVLRDEVAPLVAENAVDLSDPQPTLIRKYKEEDRLL